MSSGLSIALGRLLVCALSNAAAPAGEAESRAKPLPDRFGDPLPEGAGPRLGTLRFRTGYGARLLLAFSRDGKTVITADPEGQITHWDPLTGKHLRDLAVPSGEMALSANGRVFSCVDHGAISVRHGKTGTPCDEYRPLRSTALPCPQTVLGWPPGSRIQTRGKGVVSSS
jgi:hypothetical protein